MQLLFVYVEMDNEDTGRPVADYFGIEGNASKVILLPYSLQTLVSTLMIGLP